ncbi:hypothetical protein J5N97_016924 [Dioscorea zingiberensis]|uniref:Pentatricopeptide repeat-containing protein n=1 Tax=Dioscorea zingiberensis TaxID=325984 RepID=A0A9D5HFV4_9LILI|nr:hypothetical protein J5N97_016924 [Dioscorea zingiberensis]
MAEAAVVAITLLQEIKPRLRFLCRCRGAMQVWLNKDMSIFIKYGIERSIEHYGCMVDLYGRGGLLEEAFEFVMKMPIKPNAVIWRTLLGACSIHGNLRLAECAKKGLSELDPSDSGNYVLLSNIYAVVGKWKDVANVRSFMRDQRLMKTHGWSFIEVDKIIYTLVASDVSSCVK